MALDSGRPVPRWIATVSATLALVVAACGGGSAAPATSGGGTPQEGGTLSIGYTAPPSSLDPQQGTSGGDYAYLYLMFDRLITFDLKTGQLQPGLATDWKFSSDGLTFTMNIRQGVTFQDGTPLDAQAVKFSLDRMKQLGDIPAQLGAVSSVEVSGQSVILHLKSAYSALPAVLADRAGMIVSPTAAQKYGKDLGGHPVGAGPYQFVSQVSNSSVTLAKSPSYWNKKVGPHLDQIVWKLFTNDTALVNAVRTGDIDVAYGVQPIDVNTLKADKALNVVVGPNLGFDMIYLNTSLAPTDSAQVRQALNYGLDRDALVQVGTNGTGQPSWAVVPPGNVYYPRSVDKGYAHNVSKAKQLMQQAGKSNVSMTCLTFAGVGYETTGPVIQQELDQVGVHITIKQESLPQSVVDFYQNSSAPCFLSAWSGRPDPAITINSLFSRSSYYNAGKGDFGVDSMIAQLNATYDQAGRAKVIDGIFKTLEPEAPYVPLYTSPAIVVLERKVGGFVPSFQGKQDFSAAYLTR